jgi:hypothetical protein
MENSRKATVIIVIVVGCLIAGIPILAYSMKFEVDEDAVWFSRDGVPHCPYCFRIVKPFVGYCSDCGRSFRWMDRQVVCWACGGRKLCDYCLGAQVWKYDLPCFNCGGKGFCPFCLDGDMAGFNVYGLSNIRHDFQRK